MKVRRLEISGFKSFADRTRLDIPDGLCAVVGPNGCGKSNVVDAMRWVLGEQSARQLRGAAMEDVLFNGASSRRPAGLAEVSVVFENQGSVSAHQFADLSEIQVTRRLYRSGDSEYLINRVPCRLKDIQQLLMDTGLGNRDYAIIEQGRVAAFIEARPEERRLWVEEAAGITRFKNQKKVSLRKMQSTQENLNRVGDIVYEVESQMSRLKRQAKKAEAHQEIRRRLHALDLTLASHDYSLYEAELMDLNAQTQGEAQRLLEATNRLASLEVGLEKARLDVVQAEQVIDLKAQARQESQERVQRAEGQVALLTQEAQNNSRLAERLEGERSQLAEEVTGKREALEKARLAAEQGGLLAGQARRRVEEAAQAVDQVRAQARHLEQTVDKGKSNLMDHMSRRAQNQNRLADLERGRGELMRRRETLASRRSGLGEELRELEAEREELDQELLDLQDQVAEAAEGLQTLEDRRREAQADHQAAAKAEQAATRRRHELSAQADALAMSLGSHQWAEEGVRALFKAVEKDPSRAQILGLVAEKLRVAPGREALAAAALGPDLQAVLVRTGAEAQALADLAQRKGLARVRILALDDLGQRSLTDPDQTQPLGALIQPEPGYEALGVLLAGAGISPDLEAAWPRGRRLAPGQRVITDQGQVLDRPGAVDSGKAQAGEVLERKNRLEALKGDLAAVQEELDHARLRREALEEDQARLDQEVNGLRQGLRQFQDELRQAEHQMVRLDESLEGKRRQVESLDFDEGQLQDELERNQEERARLEAQQEAIAGQTAGLEQELTQAREALEETRLRLEDVRQAESAARMESARLDSEAQHAGREAHRLEGEVTRDSQRLAALTTEMEGCERAIVDLAGQKRALETELAGFYNQLRTQDEALILAKNQLEEAKHQAGQLERDLKEWRQEHKVLEESEQSLRWRVKELELKRQQLCEQVGDRCHVELPQVYHEHLPDEDFDPDTGRGELERLRLKLNRLGPVNLEAITEYQALKERYDFLTEQRADLEASLEDLNRAIRKINRTSRERFMETLAEVNKSLEDIFPVLFGNGGRAELVLEEGVDALEAGLELLVEPPGKKVKNLEALSGGEKALSALAVLFALFLIRPAPFCILDEVDAPLDEANTGRFHDLVKKLSEHSQILMVTHNRGTMEIMDLLYGVTMEEKGVSKVLSVSLDQGRAMAA